MNAHWFAVVEARSVVGAVMDYVPEVAGLLGVVFVVWRMLTCYEKRNVDAPAEMGKRIDAVAADVGKRIDVVAADVSAVAGDVKYMRGVLDTLLASPPKRLAGSAFRPIPPLHDPAPQHLASLRSAVQTPGLKQ